MSDFGWESHLDREEQVARWEHYEDCIKHVANALYGVRDDWQETKRLIDKAIYKGTSCGAWIQFGDDEEDGPLSVTVGSIVEGVEWSTETHELKTDDYEDPEAFRKALWEALDMVETEAQEIWQATHGCEACGHEDPETGHIAINPNCPVCEGKGTIL